eukprot:985036-Prymnesium_polylepis.1
MVTPRSAGAFRVVASVATAKTASGCTAGSAAAWCRQSSGSCGSAAGRAGRGGRRRRSMSCRRTTARAPPRRRIAAVHLLPVAAAADPLAQARCCSGCLHATGRARQSRG